MRSAIIDSDANADRGRGVAAVGGAQLREAMAVGAAGDATVTQ